VKNIVLTGLPGSGKTTLGRLLAGSLYREFYDTDRLISARTGMTVSDIFEQRGEEYFRGLEAETARELGLKQGVVISTGGGIVLDKRNIEALGANGHIIFIDREPEMIAEHIELAARPLLKGGPERLFKLSEERRGKYISSADEILKNNGSIEAAVTALKDIAFKACGKWRCTVIGDPIGHTLSPRLHSAVFEELGVNAEYTAEHVPRGRLDEFIPRAANSGLSGFNATIPHKKDIIPFLCEVDGEAGRCGAVNTVVVRDGRLYGYNTDMEGLALALRAGGCGYHGKRVLIIGTGGAAAGIAYKAAKDGAGRVYVCGRSIDKAGEICRDASADNSCEMEYGDFTSLPAAAKASDLVINATPLGMTGYREDFESFDFLDRADKECMVCDLIYNPPETKLLAAAKKRGLRTQNGLPMLIFQALIADELFLNVKLDINRLYEKITQIILGGQNN
jgi:shikimate dehydrogenase